MGYYSIYNKILSQELINHIVLKYNIMMFHMTNTLILRCMIHKMLF